MEREDAFIELDGILDATYFSPRKVGTKITHHEDDKDVKNWKK